MEKARATLTLILTLTLTLTLTRIQASLDRLDQGDGKGMLWCPFYTPASAIGVGSGGFHGIRSVGGGAQPLKMEKVRVSLSVFLAASLVRLRPGLPLPTPEKMMAFSPRLDAELLPSFTLV
jgi:hypothetical protein